MPCHYHCIYSRWNLIGKIRVDICHTLLCYMDPLYVLSQHCSAIQNESASTGLAAGRGKGRQTQDDVGFPYSARSYYGGRCR